MNNKIKIYNILDLLKDRKALYLGNEYSFQSLDAFLNGFSLSANDSQYKSDKFNDFTYFNVWLLGHLSKHFGQAGGWYWQIHNRNLNDDENAFKEFFYFLEIFKTSKKKTEKINNLHLIGEITQDKRIEYIHKTTFVNSKSIWLKGFYNKEMCYESWCLPD